MPSLAPAAPALVPSGTPARRPRLAALDAARAVGVVAMVVGHTLDALLSAEARQSSAMIFYWKARGLTAPLFLMVSGWAVTIAISRSGLRGWAVPRGRLRRVLLLLAIGYGLRWPGWALDRLVAGDREVWAHLLAFDALHTIAVALLIAACVLALPWRAAYQALALSLLGVLAVALGLETQIGLPTASPEAVAALPASVPAMALAQAIGGTSAFPLFPWLVYFFAGSVLGLLAPQDRRGATAMAAAGAALVAATFWTGVGTRQPGDPLLVAFRVGVILLLLAALSLVPPTVASHAAPLGRSSLGVYAIHLPIVYGWSTFPGLSYRVGARLSVEAAAAVAALVLVVSYALHRALVAGSVRAGAWLRSARAGQDAGAIR